MPCGDGGLRDCSLLGRNPGFSRIRVLSDRAEDRQAECKEPKNDMVNTEATAEFISRPTTCFVEEQTPEHQGRGRIFRLRVLPVAQRTQSINASC